VLPKIREILGSSPPSSRSCPFRDPQGDRAAGSTCQRLVANMVVEQFLDRVGDRYRIGLRLGYWAAPARPAWTSVMWSLRR